MKGIRLFVRAATPEDEEKIASFWKDEERTPVGGATRLLGFLLGEIAASVSFDLRGDAVEIRDFWVARNLRRKRVARAMLAELDREAIRLGAERLVIHPDIEFVDAFRRLGFSDASAGVLVRPLERAR